MQEETLAALSNSPLLAALTQRQREQIASIAKTRQFEPGELLVREGSTGALAMWVILEGTVEITRGGKKLAELGPGAHIGEIAVLGPEGTPRSATVTARQPTRVLQITKWDLTPMVKANSDLAHAIIEELAQRLIATDMRLVEAAGS